MCVKVRTCLAPLSTGSFHFKGFTIRLHDITQQQGPDWNFDAIELWHPGIMGLISRATKFSHTLAWKLLVIYWHQFKATRRCETMPGV
jgi:hypothetical protein